MRKAYQDKLDGTVDTQFFKSVHQDYQTPLDAVTYRSANMPDCLQQTCCKAGLPPNAYLAENAVIYTFRAIVFGESVH